MGWLKDVSNAKHEVDAARAEADQIRNAPAEDVGADDGDRSTARMEAAHRGFWSAVAGKTGDQ